jgi:hypothetical protein
MSTLTIGQVRMLTTERPVEVVSVEALDGR